MLTQDEIIIYPSPSQDLPALANSERLACVERFPLSQILSQNNLLFADKISAPQSSTDAKDYLVVMTSDLVIHTLELSLSGSMDSKVSPQQIKILSSHDTKNVVAASEIPKLKQVISSSVLQFNDYQIIFILFDNLSYLVASVKNRAISQGASGTPFITTTTEKTQEPYKPIVESSWLDSLEIENYHNLVDIVCSNTLVYQIMQNQPQPGNPDTSFGQTLAIYAPVEVSFAQVGI